MRTKPEDRQPDSTPPVLSATRLKRHASPSRLVAMRSTPDAAATTDSVVRTAADDARDRTNRRGSLPAIRPAEPREGGNS